jgi:hypothetical protein
MTSHVQTQRISLGVRFVMPPYGSDDMYLIAPKLERAETFWTLLGKPFSPFQGPLWLGIVGYILLSAWVAAFTDKSNDEDFENHHYISRYMKSLYLMSLSYVKGGPENNPASVPARISALGFGFFCMIVLTSYTANLASLLVAKAGKNSINSIEDAIENNLKICILASIKTEFQANYPKAIFVESSDGHDQLAKSLPGPGEKESLKVCDVFITSKWEWEKIEAGEYAKLDCDLEAAGKPPKVVGRKLCKKTDDGKEVYMKRDCEAFTLVGSLLSQIPLSIPVSTTFESAFGNKLRTIKESGVYNKFWEASQEKTQPKSACPASAEAADETQGADISSMIGTLAISLVLQVIAILLAAIEHRKKLPIQKVLGFKTSEEEPEEPDADVAEEFGTGKAEMSPEALREEVSAVLGRLELLFEVKVGSVTKAPPLTDANGKVASPAASAAAPDTDKSQAPATCDDEQPKPLKAAHAAISWHAVDVNRPTTTLVDIQTVGATKEDNQGHEGHNEKEAVMDGALGFPKVIARGFNPAGMPVRRMQP